MSQANADRTAGTWGRPQTRLGRITVVIGVLLVAWLVVFPMVRIAFRGNSIAGMSPGQMLVTSAVVFGVAGSAIGLHAIVRQRERSPLVFAVVIPMVLLTLFWVLFAAGEILFPH